ncbi:hypothetical protein GCM10022405_36110 [Gibbsiella dentisursi]|uniref:Uncharacterized protein n=1 Tax=Gibbsiella dentisursi TaxID=796890 RepID=A0ABP7LU73_9GAMM
MSANETAVKPPAYTQNNSSCRQADISATALTGLNDEATAAFMEGVLHYNEAKVE